MKKLIFIFPGQASQFVGMGKNLFDESPAARKILNFAANLDGLSDLPSIIFEGPEELLTRTDNVQPAITAVSLMAWAAITERAEALGISISPAACAGHSLGEYSAHAAAGNLSIEQALKLTMARGKWMNEASQPPNPKGGMIAVMGISFEKIEEIVAMKGNGQASIANINSPGQVIISGESSTISAIGESLSTAGAKRIIPLNVSGAWHSPLMKSAREKMEVLLKSEITSEHITLHQAVPVVANASSDIVHSVEEMRGTLGSQITSPVVWTECVRRLLTTTGFPGLPNEYPNADVEWPLFVEVGPGKVLRGLLRSIDKGLETAGVEDMASLEALFGALG